MWFITKTKQDNNITDRRGLIFIEYDIKLSRLNGQCAVQDENETRQQRDQSYGSTLRQKLN